MRSGRNPSQPSILFFFCSSTACLVCDRDLMNIYVLSLKKQDVSSESNIRLQESILATILVCDWNVRAWTLVAIYQARNRVFLLCKWNDIVSIDVIFRTVVEKGSINIGIFLAAADHLLPRKMAPKGDQIEHFQYIQSKGTVSPGSRAHIHWEGSTASQPSTCVQRRRLVHNLEVADRCILSPEPGGAVDQETWIWYRNGPSLFGTPRVQGYAGLSWAFQDPVVRPVLGLVDQRKIYPPMLYGTAWGHITTKELRAEWRILTFPAFSNSRSPKDQRHIFISDAVTRRFSFSKENGALLWLVWGGYRVDGDCVGIYFVLKHIFFLCYEVMDLNTYLSPFYSILFLVYWSTDNCIYLFTAQTLILLAVAILLSFHGRSARVDIFCCIICLRQHKIKLRQICIYLNVDLDLPDSDN